MLFKKIKKLKREHGIEKGNMVLKKRTSNLHVSLAGIYIFHENKKKKS